MIIVLRFIIWISRKVYNIMKRLFPIKKGKVLFLSRQYNTASLDFQMLISALREQEPAVQIVTITRRAEKNLISTLGFAIVSIRSMYHLATAEVCILDTYWPAVSVLQHKKELTIIQIWHAAGKIKKSGHQTLGKGYGRKQKLASVMQMHEGYDVVIAGGEAMNASYCASFHISEKKLLNYGLPRLDYVREKRRDGQQLFLNRHPECTGKRIILYAPTFRPGKALRCEGLIECFSGPEYVFIVRPHPNQQFSSEILTNSFPDASTLELLAACDYLITDYSAITIEAAAASVKTLFYLYDYSDYKQNNGLNIDLPCVIPSCCFFHPEDLERTIRANSYDTAAMDAFAAQYLPNCLGHCTEKITGLILDCLRLGKEEALQKRMAPSRTSGEPAQELTPAQN